MELMELEAPTYGLLTTLSASFLQKNTPKRF